MQRTSQPREVTRYLRFQTLMIYEQESQKRVVDIVKFHHLSSLLSNRRSLLLRIQTLYLTTVRLIGSPTLGMPTRLERRRSLQLMSLLAKGRGRNTLICVRRLLNDHLLMRALARAAAHAECPEQTGGDAEGDTNPHDLQHLVAHRGIDIVGLERGVEDARQDAVDAGCGCGGSDGEDGGGLKRSVWRHERSESRRHTVDRIVVTRLPHLEKIAKKPTTNSAAVKTVAMIKAQFIQPATFLYVLRPFCRSSPSTFCTDVFCRPQTSTGLNQNCVWEDEQYVIFSTPFSFSPEQYDHSPTW